MRDGYKVEVRVFVFVATTQPLTVFVAPGLTKHFLEKYNASAYDDTDAAKRSHVFATQLKDPEKGSNGFHNHEKVTQHFLEL